MALIKIKTEIKADIKTCFDLARNIDVHQESMQHSGEIAISGKTSGLIELRETVTWEAKHFGFVQHLTSKITELEAPYYFVDEMIFGAFKSFRHEHRFQEKDGLTIMIDEFHFESPFYILGKFANWLFLKRYMTNLLEIRNSILKEKAESLVRV
ncbi:cell division protein [Flavivirga aquatica]|uniref:Cell division protein n=1 Tax=Flavivirga aquatica TaxID=1849968 RepID=A0A1E5T8Q5_9FLAO|nr:SRPBCC family protein [Flavivirga aquatica]OEK07718.1 cell division protein [Flavivirga aquatica]